MTETATTKEVAGTRPPKISVIVPVYKVEKYLPECIESILAQTFTDFELILVDDGSPDNSGKICDDYAARDSRIRVFHKENGGVSSARNLGLDNARGEWIAFVDSDDWVGEKYLEHLFGDGNLPDSCMVMSGHVKRDSKSKQEFGRLFFDSKTLPTLEAFRKEKLYKSGYPISKLYRREILNSKNIRFDPEISMAEDTLLMMDYLMCVEKVVFRSDFLDYNYRFVEASLSKSYGSFEKEFRLFLGYRERFEGIVGLEKTTCSERSALVWTFFRAVSCLYRPPVCARTLRMQNIRKSFFSLNGNEFFEEDLSLRERLLLKKYFRLFDFVELTLFGLRYHIFKFLWEWYRLRFCSR